MRRHCVFVLILSVAILVVMGIVMLYSTGAYASDARGDSLALLKRQTLWLGIGLAACVLLAQTDYHFWQKTWWVWFLLAAILLALCFIPPIGKRINGSSRWITIGFSNFQPSEFAKFASIAFLAWWGARFENDATKFFKGLFFPMAIVGVLLALIGCEVDIGTTALIGITSMAVLFVSGANLLYFGAGAAIGIAGAIGLIFAMPERTGRFLAFLDPEKYPADAYQTLQGLIAFGSGGVTGLGLGNGRQKMAYLPFAHTDFIFPMVGEELGLVATLTVVACYILFIIAGAYIVLRARDRFGFLLGTGLLIMIGVQAAVNIGVTTSLLPNKGMPLPFISYGGSNLLFCLAAVGVFINIYRQGRIERLAIPAKKLHARLAPAKSKNGRRPA